MSIDPAYGSQPMPTDPFANQPQPYSGFGNQVQTDLSSGNAIQQIAGQIGGSAELQAGLANSQVGAAEQNYLSDLANSALSNTYATNEAGYQTGQLQLSGEKIGIQQLGNTQESQLQGIEQPIASSQLQGSLAAQGALNTKGSTQQQQQLGAQQTYTNQQLANAQKTLGIMAQANGMSVGEVQNQLQYALTQSGLQDQMSATDLLMQIGQIQGGELGGLENTLSPILLGGNLNMAQVQQPKKG